MAAREPDKKPETYDDGSSGYSGNGFDPNTHPESADEAALNQQFGITDFHQPRNLTGTIYDIIGVIAKVIGVLLASFGLYKTILGLKDQDTTNLVTGLSIVVVGIAAFFLPNIINGVYSAVMSSPGNTMPN